MDGADSKEKVKLIKSHNTLEIGEHKEDRSRCQTIAQKLWTFFVKNYLPIVLIFAVVFGALVPQPGVFFNHKITVYVCVGILFFYVGLYLQMADIKDMIWAYKAYVWGILSVLCITCVIGGNLTNLLPFDSLGIDQKNITTNDTENMKVGPFECKVGLVMYHIMPCTVGSGVIMVMAMNGHVALGIFITVVCNVVGIFTIPLYLKWLVYSNVNVDFDIGAMMFKLFCSLFVPLFIGKLLRFNKRICKAISVPSRKIKLKMFAFTGLAFILLIKTSQSSHNGDLKLITGMTGAVICFWALALHCIFILLNTGASLLLRLPNDQRTCIIILASQKTLSQAVAASVFLPEDLGDPGLIAVTMVFCHITVLVFDSIFIQVWAHISLWREREKQSNAYLYIQ